MLCILAEIRLGCVVVLSALRLRGDTGAARGT